MASANAQRESPGARQQPAQQSNGRANGRTSTTGKTSARTSMRDAVRTASDQVGELIGRPVEAVSGVETSSDGWLVSLEVVELERIPPTTSVLATYEVELDKDAQVQSFTRVRRYYRNQAGDL